MKKQFLEITVFILVILSIAACGASSSVRINMAGSNWGNQMDFTYKTFTGYEVNRLNVEAGDTIELTYDMVINKGSLHLQVIAPNEATIWGKEMVESENNSIEIDTELAGEYVLRIDAENAGGSMDVSWEIK